MSKYDGYSWIKVPKFQDEDVSLLDAEELVEEYNRFREHHHAETKFLIETVREVDAALTDVRQGAKALAADLTASKRSCAKLAEEHWFAHEIASERLFESASRRQAAEDFIAVVRKSLVDGNLSVAEVSTYIGDALSAYDEKCAAERLEFVKRRHARECEQMARKHATESNELSEKQNEERVRADPSNAAAGTAESAAKP